MLDAAETIRTAEAIGIALGGVTPSRLRDLQETAKGARAPGAVAGPPPHPKALAWVAGGAPARRQEPHPKALAWVVGGRRAA